MVRIDCEALARSVVGADVVRFDRGIKDDQKNWSGDRRWSEDPSAAAWDRRQKQVTRFLKQLQFSDKLGMAHRNIGFGKSHNIGPINFERISDQNEKAMLGVQSFGRLVNRLDRTGWLDVFSFLEFRERESLSFRADSLSVTCWSTD